MAPLEDIKLELAPGIVEDGTVTPVAHETTYAEEAPVVTLPDGGYGWFVVLGCFILAAITLGFNLAWGVFQNYYYLNTLKGTSMTALSFVGSIQGGVGSLLSVVTGKLGDRFGYKRFLLLSAFCTVASTLFSAFSRSFWEFALAQGVLQGLSTGFAFPFIVAYPAQWFRKRRAFAMSIVISGGSLGGATATLIVTAMLDHIGLRNTLLVYSGIHFFLLVVAILLVREGPGRAPTIVHRKGFWDWHLFKDIVFWSFASCLTIAVFGFYNPYFFMPSFVQAKLPSARPELLTLPISIMNFSAGLGRPAIGYISDRIGPINMLLCGLLLAGFSQLVIWSLSSNYAGIMVFSVIFGVVGGAYLSLMAPVAAQLYGTTELATIVGILSIFLIPGNLAGAPVGAAIFNAAGDRWIAIICYSGASYIVAFMFLLYARFARERRVWSRI